MAGSGVLKLLGKGIVPTTMGGAFLTPEESEATFGGITAKGAKSIIADAARMEARGMSRDDIWKASFDKHQRGAFKGGDGLWRVEFNDFAEQLKYPNGFDILNSVLGQSEINQAYNFNDTLVQVNNMSYGGAFNRGSATSPPKIEIPRIDAPLSEEGFQNLQREFGPGFTAGLRTGEQEQRGSAYKTLMHETQHRIQAEEGMASGSSPDMVGGYENYVRTAGEVEARNVADRMDMSTDSKYQLPPWMTEDVAEEGRLYLGGEDLRKALKRQSAFLASIGLSASAVAGDNELTIDDPEVQAFVERAKEQGYNEAQISAYLEKQSNIEPVEQPYAARTEALTEEEYQEALELASPQQIAQYEAEINKRTIDYDALDESSFAEPSKAFVPIKDYLPEVGDDGVPTGDDIPIFDTLSSNEVTDIARELRVDPRTRAGINAVYAQSRRNRFAGGSKELVSALKEVQQVDRPWLWMKSHFDTDANIEYQRMQQHTTETIISQLKERGIEARYDKQNMAYMGRDPNGQWVEITPGFMEEMGASKYEAVGSIGGAGGGVAIIRSMGPYGKWAQIGAGAIGAIAGAVVGDQVDYLSAAIETQQDFDAQIAAEKALGTANTAVLWEVGLLGAGKVGSTGWKWIRQSFRNLKDGNTQGAYEALKQAVGYATDEEIDEVIKRWEKLNERTAPTSKSLAARGSSTTSRNEQALSIAPTTMAGGENVIGASVKIDPQASSAVAAEINKRAQDVIKLAAAPEDTGKQLVKSLSDYEREVRTHFAVIKNQGAEFVPNDFRFNFRDTSIKPLIEAKMANMDDPAKLDTLQRVLAKVDNATKTRSFDDLLDLRRTINDFKFNRKITRKSDYNAINEGLSNIDTQIESAMNQSTEGRQWLKDWKAANRDYSKYAQVRQGALWKAVRKPGVSETDIARHLLKYGKPIDSTFEDVMEKIPPTVRANVESSMVDQLISKYTAGKEGEFRAIYFPELARALKPYNLTTPNAGRMKKAVERMSEVYKNDVRLAAASGKITVPGFQSYLTDDPTMRLKMAGISHAFNYVRRLIPGGKADALAMAGKVADLLENPLNTKTVDQVMKTIQEEEGLTAAIKRLQSATAREQAQSGENYKIKVFKDSSGKMYATPGTGRTASSETLPIHRIATEDIVKQMLQIKKIDSKTLTRANRLKLVDAGFLKIRLADGQLLDLGQ